MEDSAVTGSVEPQSKLKKAKQKTKDRKFPSQREAIKKATDLLNEEKRCEKCGAVTLFTKDGYTYYAFCPCELLKFKTLALGKRFASVKLEDIKPRNSRQAEIKRLLLKKPMGNYFFWGELSSGKSHFLAGLYNYAMDHNYLDEIRFFTDRELKKDLVDFEMDRLGDRVPVFTIDYLREGRIQQVFWDDIGKVKVSEFVQQEIFSVVDEVYRRDLRLVAASNYNLDELAEILGVFGNAIVRRINDICKVIKF